MSDRAARIRATLLVPGTPPTAAAWAASLAPVGVELRADHLHHDPLGFEVPCQWIENDGGFGDAFSYGTVTPAEQAAIAAAPGALLLELPVDLHRHRSQIAGLVDALAHAGALAVRLEQSKLGWSVRRWVEQVGGDDPWSLYRAIVVVLASREEGVAHTVGMHAFSLPDAEVALDEESNALLGAFNVYQLDEDPLLRPRQTFRPDASAPRRQLERWPATSYPSGHPCHNPFGVWRLGPPGGEAGSQSEQVAVFVPALVALLLSLERRAGQPLTRDQVEQITADAACLSMDPAAARALERDRGYADLDPTLVWDQWEAFRATLTG